MSTMNNVHAVDFRLRSERPTASKTSTTATAKAVAQGNAEGEAKAMQAAIWGAALSGILVACFVGFGAFGVWENPNVDYDAPAPAEQIVQPAR